MTRKPNFPIFHAGARLLLAVRGIMVDLLKGVRIVNFTHFLFGPMGALDKLGLSYEVLKKENPGLIYAAATGYGPNGPYVSRPAGPQLSSHKAKKRDDYSLDR